MKTPVSAIIEKFNKLFGTRSCYKVWVDNINNGQKYIVRCAFRDEWLGRRVTVKYQQTVK